MEPTQTLPAKLDYVIKQVKTTQEHTARIVEAMLPFYEKLEKWNVQIKNLKPTSPEDDETMNKAREGRILIQKTRLHAVEIIDRARKFLQDSMADTKNADTLWLRAKQSIEQECKTLESQCKEVEETRIRNEARVKEELRTTRRAQIVDLCDNPDIYPLGEMSEGDFQNLKAVLTDQHNRWVEAEEKMRRLEELEKQEVEQERIRLRQENEKLQRKQKRVRELMLAGMEYTELKFHTSGINGSIEFSEEAVAEMTDADFALTLTEATALIKSNRAAEASRKELDLQRWRSRTSALFGALVWSGPADETGHIFDSVTENILLSYTGVVTLSDEDYDSYMKPFYAREIARREQAGKEAAKQAEEEAKAKAAQEKKDARYKDMYDMGLKFDGEQFCYRDINFHWSDILTYDDAKWQKTVEGARNRMQQIQEEEAERKLKEIDELNNVPFDTPIATAIPATGSMKSRLTAWVGTLKFPEPPGEYTGKGLKEVTNMRDGFLTWVQFCEERIKKL